MNAAFGTTPISHEDFAAGLVVLRVLTPENMINAIDAEHDGQRDNAFANLQPVNGSWATKESMDASRGFTRHASVVTLSHRVDPVTRRAVGAKSQ